MLHFGEQQHHQSHATQDLTLFLAYEEIIDTSKMGNDETREENPNKAARHQQERHHIYPLILLLVIHCLSDNTSILYPQPTLQLQETLNALSILGKLLHME